MNQIVGWILESNHPCDLCRQQPATVIFTRDGINVDERCDGCTPTGASDPIGQIFARALSSLQR
jgi:hypothetical protein